MVSSYVDSNSTIGLVFNRLLLQRLDDKVEQPEKIDVLQASQMAVPAWTTGVDSVTIQNWFRHCKIRT